MTDNWMSGLSKVLDRDAAGRKAYLASWNAQYTPLQEMTEPETECVTGVFLLDDRWYFGDRYANGYHPEKLIEVPSLVAQTIARVINEK